jgi:hypothetical protein
MTKPITPDEVEQSRTADFPPEVLDAFNEEIKKRWNGLEAVVKQKDVVDRIVKALGITPKEVGDRDLLDVEEVYRRNGWRVDYDKPGFNDGWYEPTFTFRKSRAQS